MKEMSHRNALLMLARLFRKGLGLMVHNPQKQERHKR
jgi:hypothetical protein